MGACLFHRLFCPLATRGGGGERGKIELAALSGRERSGKQPKPSNASPERSRRAAAEILSAAKDLERDGERGDLQSTLLEEAA